MSRQSAAVTSATLHAMSPEFGGRWGAECLNTRFPLPTLLYARYSVKLKINVYIYIQSKNFYYKKKSMATFLNLFSSLLAFVQNKTTVASRSPDSWQQLQERSICHILLPDTFNTLLPKLLTSNSNNNNLKLSWRRSHKRLTVSILFPLINILIS